MKKFDKLLVLSAVMAVLLVGCSAKGDSTPGASKNGEVVESSVTDTTVVEETTEEVTEVETVEGITYPHTFTDEAGREMVFETEPVKVAISYLPHWESLMMLDVMPIATNMAEHYASTWDAFEGLDLSSVVDLGNPDVNLELLAELEPDVILQQASDLSKVDVSKFEKIANVAVMGPQVKMDWRHSLRAIAKVVNKEAKAEEVIANLDAKLADARVKLQEKYKGETTMLLSVMGEDRYFIAYRPDLYDAETGLGLVAPEGFTANTNYEQISLEALAQMNPDNLFVNVFDGDEAFLEALENNSVFQAMNAAKNNRVFRLDGSGHAASAMATEHTVNFIIETLLGTN